MSDTYCAPPNSIITNTCPLITIVSWPAFEMTRTARVHCASAHLITWYPCCWTGRATLGQRSGDFDVAINTRAIIRSQDLTWWLISYRSKARPRPTNLAEHFSPLIPPLQRWTGRDASGGHHRLTCRLLHLRRLLINGIDRPDWSAHYSVTVS